MLTLLSRCFPHIVNLAVKAGLATLTEIMPWDEELDDELSNLVADPSYRRILQDDVVKMARQLVHFIRDSGQRREDFEAVIKQGNAAKSWGKDKNGNDILLRIVGLLKDVETRWSSTFLMIDRVIELRQVYFHQISSYRVQT